MVEKKYIPLDAAIAAIKAVPEGNWKNSRYTKAIESIPAADVVEVVRCKDCKHRPFQRWRPGTVPVHDRGV